MARVFLAVWLAVFAVQTSDLLLAVAPDACTEDVQGSVTDPCPDGCSRCLCCARVPAFIPHALIAALPEAVARMDALPPLAPSTTPSPHGVLHIPKRSLT